MLQLYLPIAELSVNVLMVLGLGLLVGVLSGMFGIGGGFLLTPALIFVGVPRLFTRPLRLNSVEAFELLAAARTAMELPGADPDGALARGLAKLATALGEDDTAGVRVELERPELADRLVTAATEHQQLLIEYISAARDETTSRQIGRAHV